MYSKSAMKIKQCIRGRYDLLVQDLLNYDQYFITIITFLITQSPKLISFSNRRIGNHIGEN